MLAKVRAAVVVLLIAGLVLAGVVGYRLFTEEPPAHEPTVSRSTGTTDDGWQVVTYRGVDVEVPPDWRRLEATGCEGATERWGPAGLDPCAPDAGLWFRDAATFDTGFDPGVHVAPVSANLPEGGWTGYVTRGQVVVDVADPDQAVVRRILQSVGATI